MITKDEYILTKRLFQGEIKVEDWVDELESILRSLEDMVEDDMEDAIEHYAISGSPIDYTPEDERICSVCGQSFDESVTMLCPYCHRVD